MTVESYDLLGEYQTPAFQVGDVVECAMRGAVKIVGVTAGRIAWPTAKQSVGRKNATPAIVLYDCLVDAVQKESNRAICHLWGVTGQTVSQWRKVLGIGRSNPGTSRLHAEHYRDHVGEAMRRALLPALRSPERRAKISAAKLGKPRPDLSERNRSRRGAKLSDKARQHMKVAWQRHGFVGGKKGARAWTPAEDELVRTLPTAEAARLMGRTLASVGSRRRKLRANDQELTQHEPTQTSEE